ncbi:response regulator [Macrococcus equipercicus]|uniref:Response regulator ArlR n=1 Tax=Macrococcus equipercicus TaxID=69967 RepID=A0ABQ6R9Z9_9STAP|nr:response regulator [Macrococcus equipercicus]KAA1040134.1 response regulator [Macrococcus equipercicus]
MLRVAIIEDSKELAVTIKAHLTKQGIIVTDIANNGMDGRQLIEKRNFDVLLLDLVLPNIDGLTLVKNYMPRERDYKVICFSAFGKESVLIEATALGVDYFLLKPVDLDVIEQTIRRLCEHMAEPALDELFSEKLKGTQYINDAMAILQQTPEKIEQLTRSLYPEIAQLNDVNTASVERAIRHSIDKAWKQGFEQKWQAEGKYTKPTVGELLDYLMR